MSGLATVDPTIVESRGATVAPGQRRRLNGALTGGATLIGLLFVASFVVPALWHQGPREPNPIASFQAPSWSHPFGTDSQGFDIFVRTLYAPRYDLTLAVAGVLIALVIGVGLGLFAGLSRGWLGDLALRITDVVQAFPLLILALTLVALTGNHATNVIWAIVLINVPMFLRLTRSSVLSIREQRFIDAAVAVGNPRWRVATRHVLPNAIGPVIVQAGVNMGYAILTIAALAFLGVGIQVPTPEWGSMILIGRGDVITGEWWTALFPGLALATAVVGFNLMADGIERLREVRR
jgi:peptide/nickel transport system permease protein